MYQTLDVDLWPHFGNFFDFVCDVDCKDASTLKALPNGGYESDKILIMLTFGQCSEEQFYLL